MPGNNKLRETHIYATTVASPLIYVLAITLVQQRLWWFIARTPCFPCIIKFTTAVSEVLAITCYAAKDNRLFITHYLLKSIELINEAWHYASAVKVGHFEWITM